MQHPTPPIVARVSFAVVLAPMLTAALIVAGVAAPAHAGPVNVTNQARSIHVAIPSIVPEEPAVDETTTAPDNNPFNATLDRTLNQLDEVNHARASQNSSFSNAGDNFSCNAAGESRYSATGLSGIVFSESPCHVEFLLGEERTYSLTGSGSFVDTSGGASNFSVILLGPGSVEVARFDKALYNPNNNDGAVVTPNFSTGGTLQPGSYTLTAMCGVSGGPNSNEIQASYDVHFSATASNAAIPLPAALVPGGVMLLATLTVAARKRAVRRT